MMVLSGMPAIISGTIIARPNLKNAKDSSWNALSPRCRQISPKINRFKRQRSRKVKNVILEWNSFSMITSVFEMIEQWFWHHRVCLVKTHRKMYSMNLKGQGQNLSSGQGHGVTQIAISRSVLKDKHIETTFMSSSSQSQVICKKTLVTSGDLRRP